MIKNFKLEARVPWLTTEVYQELQWLLKKTSKYQLLQSGSLHNKIYLAKDNNIFKVIEKTNRFSK